MINLSKKVCIQPGCTKTANYASSEGGKRDYCARHKGTKTEVSAVGPPLEKMTLEAQSELSGSTPKSFANHSINHAQQLCVFREGKKQEMGNLLQKSFEAVSFDVSTTSKRKFREAFHEKEGTISSPLQSFCQSCCGKKIAGHAGRKVVGEACCTQHKQKSGAASVGHGLAVESVGVVCVTNEKSVTKTSSANKTNLVPDANGTAGETGKRFCSSTKFLAVLAKSIRAELRHRRSLENNPPHSSSVTSGEGTSSWRSLWEKN
mmetsp:Transcript_6904/g.11438  ORF Transcript_6904/g.11438 Transcript_6904/m.11438 type:complete len:262 (-) Transcript_6904:8-793(-)